MSSAILTAHRGGFHLSQLTETALDYLAFLREQNAPVAATLESPAEAVDQTLNLLISWKVVSSLEVVEGKEVFYFVEDEKKVELEFYKNSVIHRFLHHAFVAVSLLSRRQEVLSRDMIEEDYTFLRNLFRKEFIVDTAPDESGRMDAILVDFEKARWIQEEASGRGYRVTRLGHERLPAWARFARTFLESYWIVIQAFVQGERKPGKKGEDLKKMKFMGMRYFKLGDIDHLESISQLTFRNAVERLTEDVLRPGPEGPSDQTDALAEIGRRLYDFTRISA